MNQRPSLVTTIKERCRVCYTCVRECPAKAIRIYNGQAEVVAERCIGCGNCFRVCSQKAKKVLSATDDLKKILDSGEKVAACIAPSFKAEFVDMNYPVFVGMVRKLGFNFVNEVAFGADLVAKQYRELLKTNNDKRYIATTCPAIIEFVCRYHPNLTKSLAPIVSPMIALARALRYLNGEALKIIFIGPCIAKKAENDPHKNIPEIDAVLTFIELCELFEEKGITPESVTPSDFDPPHSSKGLLFPLTRGMLHAANISDDLLPGDILAADGRHDFVEAIKEFESGDLDVRLLEVLCCSGCIMGSGINSKLPLFRRRSRVLQYARKRFEILDEKLWQHYIDMFSELDLSRGFISNDQRNLSPSEKEISVVLNKIGKFSLKDELNCGACGYDTCQEHAVAICLGLAENEMCLPYNIEKLHNTLKELAESNDRLASVQEALVQSEKLASMGQLAAGIAHEINNPLGVVLMYAHLMLEEYQNSDKLHQDLAMIVEQTDRCKKIVMGLLNFARQHKVIRQPIDIRQLIERTLKTVPLPSNITLEISYKLNDPVCEIDSDQMAQVLTNLLLNAYEAMSNGGKLTVGAYDTKDEIIFFVEDTGTGISQENISKIFEPFFTTKRIGKGTGLGLAVVYGIIKMHRGDIKVKSNSNINNGPTGSVFSITLPRL